MVRRAFPLILLLTAGACARSEEAGLVADQNQTQAVERVRTPEQDDEEIALGEWRDTLQENEAALEFGPAEAPPLFSLRCGPRRALLLQRHGTLPAGDLPMMLVSIGSETRRLAVTNIDGPVPMLRATIAPSDTLIRTFAEAATPIVIRIGDSAPLALPPGPAIPNFLGRCESSTPAPAADEESDSDSNSSAPANEAAAATPPAPTR